jgi:predicted O-methyltransferase YrrM
MRYGEKDAWRPEIPGWSSDILPWYAALASLMPDGSRIVEVGVYCGRSLLFLAEEFWREGKRRTHLWGVDHFVTFNSGTDGEVDCWREFNRHFDSTGDAKQLVDVMRGPSAIMAQSFENVSLDLVFIDADHGYESMRADLAAWTPKVRPGGVIAGHDFEGDACGQFPGVQQAVCEAFGRPRVQRPIGSVWVVQL